MNSEQATFENALHVTGAAYAPLIARYEENFATMFDTGRVTHQLDQLQQEVKTATTIPLVFDSMALTWSELDQLRRLIRENCADADSQAFRDNPLAHKTCTRS